MSDESLDIFSRPPVIENSRQYFVLRTDILQKTVVGCPWCQTLKVKMFFLIIKEEWSEAYSEFLYVSTSTNTCLYMTVKVCQREKYLRIIKNILSQEKSLT